VGTVNEIRVLYMEKLKFHLIYGNYELEPIKARILELDEIIEENR
jgi:hypothetical protein